MYRHMVKKRLFCYTTSDLYQLLTPFMSGTLYLTADEQKTFAKLPAPVRGAWSAKDEKLTFADNENRRRLRAEMMKVQSPVIKSLQEKVQTLSSEKEVQSLLKTIDLSGVSHEDLGELMFAFGPDGLTWMIAKAITDVSSEDDVSKLAELTEVRHGMLQSLQNFAS